MPNCENQPCLWSKGDCLLEEAVKKSRNLKDLEDHWHNLVDKCPNAEDLFLYFQQKQEELKKKQYLTP